MGQLCSSDAFSIHGTEHEWAGVEVSLEIKKRHRNVNQAYIAKLEVAAWC